MRLHEAREAQLSLGMRDKKHGSCSVPKCSVVGPITWLADRAGGWFAFCTGCAPVYRAGGYKRHDDG